MITALIWRKIKCREIFVFNDNFCGNFTLKITSARAYINARLNRGPAVSKVEKNKGPGYKTSKYGMREMADGKILALHAGKS